MALGGGSFTTQNKILPGTYINFVSAASASATLSERGIVAMALELDWGVDGEIFTVTNSDFQTNCKKIFGYECAHDKLKGLRELFTNASTLYAYRLNTGVKASNSYATALCSGVRGNDFKIVIAANVDDDDLFDVSLYLDNELIETQTVSSAADLIDNDYVSYIKTATLAATAGTPLSSGTNGTVISSNHQAFLDKAESYSYNIMALTSSDSVIKQLYVSYVKRLRDEIGVKFQVVLHSLATADYEGVISVKNECSEDTTVLVYWVAGLQAACAVNKSCLNQAYNGEYTPICSYTQSELSEAITNGEFAVHNVGTDVRVLSDINTLVTVTDDKGEIFKDNQTIRVIDQIANDVATIFNEKYLGTVANDEAGRISLWADIVKHHQSLQDIRAIENFSDGDVTVSAGDSKKSVVISDVITVVNAMAQLYMSVEVS